MKDMLVNVLIISGILAVCTFYFKAVILNWLSRDAELRALHDTPSSDKPILPSH
jgi:hypothetical protein